MLCDADFLIWVLRRASKATSVFDDLERRHISVVTYMELVRGARDKRELREIQGFVNEFGLHMFPLTEGIGHRASVYVEQHGLSSGLGVVDALVAATATENGLALLTGNAKHYRPIADLEVKTFRP